MTFSFDPSVVISRNGSLGMLLAEYAGANTLMDRDAIVVRFGVLLEPDTPVTTLAAVISGTADIYSPQQLGIPDFNDHEANRAFIVEAMIGEYIDAHGLPSRHTRGSAVPRVEIMSEALEAIVDRKAATDDEIEQYVRSRLYWGYRFGREEIVFTSPDFLRLRITNERLSRVLRVGEGTDWQIGVNSGLAQHVRPSMQLIRQEREQRRTPVAPSAGVPAAVAAPAATDPPSDASYVHPDRMAELKAISSQDFDLRRLIALCEELNTAWAGDSWLAVAMLTRAVIDHLPPVFQQNTFGEVANNYSGTKSFRDSMKHLHESARRIADAYLHVHIRNKESLPNATQVNFSQDLDVLLAEVVRILR